MIEEMFTQSMTDHPYSAVSPDMWIEMTMTKGSKLKWMETISENRKRLVIRNTNKVNIENANSIVQIK